MNNEVCPCAQIDGSLCGKTERKVEWVCKREKDILLKKLSPIVMYPGEIDESYHILNIKQFKLLIATGGHTTYIEILFQLAVVDVIAKNMHFLRVSYIKKIQFPLCCV